MCEADIPLALGALGLLPLIDGCTVTQHLFYLHSVQIRYKDRIVRKMKKNLLVAASLLSPSDKIWNHNHRGGCYEALILEYCRETDTFLVAEYNGSVHR